MLSKHMLDKWTFHTRYTQAEVAELTRAEGTAPRHFLAQWLWVEHAVGQMAGC